RPLRASEMLTVREARDNVYRFFIPADVALKKVALLEGSVYADSVGRRPRPIGKLSGIGAPLVIRRAPYNCPDDICTLADAVVDQGIIEELRYDERAACCEIEVSKPIHPGPGRRGVSWIVDGAVEVLGNECIAPAEGGRVWRLTRLSSENLEKGILGIAYQGSWRGTAWLCDLAQVFSSPKEGS